MENTISMSNGGQVILIQQLRYSGATNGTIVFYEIYAEDNDLDGSTSNEYSYNVTDPATTTLPYTQTFDTDLGTAMNTVLLGHPKTGFGIIWVAQRMVMLI